MHVIVSWNYEFDISLLSVFCGGLGLEGYGYGLGIGLGLGVSGLVNITVCGAFWRRRVIHQLI